MRQVIELLNKTKLSYTDISAFGQPCIYVHAGVETILRVTYNEDCFSFYDYRSQYLYEEQSVDDLELHLKSIDVGLPNDIVLNLNGNIDRDTIPHGAFLK
ncbi:hypothetical protein NVP1081O_129 [Vibrio phage 1.081.O._10N.286.52.C2]|nr:hypothetical protein NVP1081O_129 [Vibrio phage 1.081.O._10N.286.52.C2]